MDKIDELILNEDLEKVFISDEDSDRGVRFYGKKPTGKDLREKVFESFFEEDDDDDSGTAK
ncbi:MAG: hypothetical protein M0D57_03030 [Sphingobacteriales bacterium JAD_PAG50586_3]|nr:MAG: hypothetical protein M0D57_03030 [Sphingobacteriales bacterium JAD_PAG50586_3]